MGVTHCLFHSINYVVRAKWQHAQRVVPQKMATGGDENKKNNNSNKKNKIAQHGISIGSIFAYLPFWLPAACVCGCHSVCAVCVCVSVCNLQ